MPQILAWPLRLQAGRIATVDSESDEAQAQHVAVLLSTRPGERVAVPNYGTPDQVGVREYDEQAIGAAMDRWCPDAVLVDLDAALDAQESRTVTVDVRVARRR